MAHPSQTMGYRHGFGHRRSEGGSRKITVGVYDMKESRQEAAAAASAGLMILFVENFLFIRV